ncbi:MAG: HNH endonuclease signature motif containing protein, partial [Microcoleaceae cyanobacterium]
RLIKKQKGICPHCGLNFKSEDLLEVDHIIPKSKGGKDTYSNLQLLHRHCHDSKTASDGSNSRSYEDKPFVPRIYDKDGVIKEPDEVIRLTSGSEGELEVGKASFDSNIKP